MIRVTPRWAVIGLLSAMLLAAPLQAAEATLREILANPPGDMVDMGNFYLHINCKGEGSPVVVLDAGLGGFSLDWYAVQRDLSQTVKVCAYDRAGYGWSDPGPSPRATDQIVDELERLLPKAGLQPPYVMVGHSFGGYNARYYAKLNPDKVAGIALIESSHPEQSMRMPDIPGHRERIRRGGRMTTSLNMSVLKQYPPELRNTARRILTAMKSIMTQRREFLNFNQSGDQVGYSGRLPDIPLLVITRGRRVWPDNPYGNNLESIWMQMQKELLDLTSDSWQVIAGESGHLVHLQQPHLVADSIRDLLQRICKRGDKLPAGATAALESCGAPL